MNNYEQMEAVGLLMYLNSQRKVRLGRHKVCFTSLRYSVCWRLLYNLTLHRIDNAQGAR